MLNDASIRGSQIEFHHLAVGTDLVEIQRIATLIERYGRRFTERVFTSGELLDCRGRPASLAARWAAKEAVAKALKTGIGPVCFQDIEVVQDRSGCPGLRLNGQALALARERGLTSWTVSLAHDGGLALAFVVAVECSATVKTADDSTEFTEVRRPPKT